MTDESTDARGPGGFERLRPRAVEAGGGPVGIDAEGKQALFSAGESRAALGGLTVACSHCGQESVLTGRQAVRSLLPSVHLPKVRSPYRSWLRCPSCGHRAWVEIKLGR